MKLSVVGPVFPYRGGIAQFTTLLCEQLNKEGHQVQTVSFRRQYPRWLYPGKSDKDPSLHPSNTDALFLLDPLDPLSWKHTADAILAFQPEAVVLQWWVTVWAPAYKSLARRLKQHKIPLIFIIHNVIPHEPHFWDRFAARSALASGDCFIVQSQRERVRLEALVPGSHILECSHPTFYHFTSQRIPKGTAKQKLGIDPTTPVLLYFGIVRPYKGLKNLLRACQGAVATGENFKLIVAGEFWEPEGDYHQLIDELNLTQQVQIINRYIPDEEVSLYFSAADVFAAPHLHGTQSGAARIASSFNLPLLISDAIVDEDLLQTPANLVEIVHPTDLTQFSQAICLMLSKVKAAGELAEVNQPGKDTTWGKLVNTIEACVQEVKKTA